MLKMFLIAALVAGAPPVLADEIKIGFVDPVALIEQAPQGEAALRKLEEEFGPRDRELRELRDQIEAMEEDLEKNTLVMAGSEVQQKQIEIASLKRKLQRSQQAFKDDYNLRRNEELARLQQVVTDAIIEIAEAEGYDLIVQQAVFASKAINITDQVLEKLGKGE